MPRPNEPEMRPQARGERVFLADLEVGDVLDSWSRRSGGFFVQEDIEVLEVAEDSVICTKGLVLRTDANWGELRRLRSRPS